MPDSPPSVRNASGTDASSGSSANRSKKSSGIGLWQRTAVAEGVGFEPTVPVNPGQRFSRPPHSSALPPLRGARNYDLGASAPRIPADAADRHINERRTFVGRGK